MPSDDGTEPVTDDEIVFRRIPAQQDYYNPSAIDPVSWLAFRPNKNDTDGLTVWRAKYKTAQEAAFAGAREGKSYYVVAIRVADLRSAEFGVLVEPTIEHGGIGHASLSNLTYGAYERDKNEIQKLARRIAGELCSSIEGPFDVPADS